MTGCHPFPVLLSIVLGCKRSELAVSMTLPDVIFCALNLTRSCGQSNDLPFFLRYKTSKRKPPSTTKNIWVGLYRRLLARARLLLPLVCIMSASKLHLACHENSLTMHEIGSRRFAHACIPTHNIQPETGGQAGLRSRCPSRKYKTPWE